MRRLWLAALTALGVHGSGPEAIELRVQHLLEQLTVDEKVSLVSGDMFNTQPIPRLGIPALTMTDGPMGVRWRSATAWPAGVAMAASFNPPLVQEASRAIAREAKALGRDMLLGPCVTIARTPWGGRNFECSGEDPFLASELARNYVQGVQAEQVIATTKHFAVNDQETNRLTVNVKVSERALQEIHFPAFRAAVEAGSWAVMSAYNRVNGPFASDSADLLTRVLKQDWGFRGFVVSDWDANHSTVESANAGLDLEMPSPNFWGSKLKMAMARGEVAMSVLDDKVRRLLRAMASQGLLDTTKFTRPAVTVVGSEAHRSLSRRMAEESLVLLKNEQSLLPLQISKETKIAVLGGGAFYPRTGGGGSSLVIPSQADSIVRALEKSVEPGTHIVSHIGARLPWDYDKLGGILTRPSRDSNRTGLRGEYFANLHFRGEPALVRVDEEINFDWMILSPGVGLPADGFSVRWTGEFVAPKSGDYSFISQADDGVRLFLNNRLVLDASGEGYHERKAKTRLTGGQVYFVRIEYQEFSGNAGIKLGWALEDPNELADAVALAAQSDVALIFVGESAATEGENVDRTSLRLHPKEEDLVRAVSRVNPRTVVVLSGGGPILMDSWILGVQAVVQSWYPGQEGAYAIVDALLGQVNPSGKLPVSFLKQAEDASSHGHYPGQNGEVIYQEGIFVGYRHLDHAGIEPLFPFGHGLSYSRFQLSDLSVETRNLDLEDPQIDVKVRLTNTGERFGGNVVQLYVAPLDPPVSRPPQELKGFQKLFLPAGEGGEVQIKLRKSAFAYFDESTHAWTVSPGGYELRVGLSSRDIQQRHRVRLVKAAP